MKDERLFFRLVEVLFPAPEEDRYSARMKRLTAQRSRVPYADLRIEALAPEQIGELSDACADGSRPVISLRARM